jgi:hypothetical protein
MNVPAFAKVTVFESPALIVMPLGVLSTGHSRQERKQHVYAVLQQYGGYVLAGVGMVGWFLMFLRYRACQRAYLQRLPPVNGVPLDMYTGADNPWGPESRAIWRAMFKHQGNPELEHMRRQVWRRFGHFGLWTCGYPVLALGVAACVLTVFPH